MKSLRTKLAILLLASLLVTSLLPAETMSERDYKQMRTDHDRATSAALEPINRRYKDDLEKLFKRAIQASELDLARQIQAELQAVGGAATAKAADESATTPTPAAMPAGQTELRKLIENSEWQLFGNPKASSSVGSMIFERNGRMRASGINYSSFYSIEAPNLLKTYDRDPKRNPKEPYRTFKVDMLGKTATQDLSLSTRDGSWFIKYTEPSKIAR